MRRVVYGCDWCGAKDEPRDKYDDDTIPAEWERDEATGDLMCVACFAARAVAINDAKVARGKRRRQT